MNTLTPLVSTQEAAQKIFDWFSRQDAVFAVDSQSCVYRGDQNPESNVRCAFGCIIPNEIYAEAMYLGKSKGDSTGIEGNTASCVLLDSTIAMKMYFANVDSVFLDKAQTLHDHYARAGNSMQHFLSHFCVMCKANFDIDIDFGYYLN